MWNSITYRGLFCQPPSKGNAPDGRAHDRWIFLSSKESEMKIGKKKAEKKFTFIDLFAGCGGLMEFSL